MKIRAAVLRAGDRPYSIEPLELADPLPHEILVEVKATGMCHTDMIPRAPEFAALAPLPLVPGHEGAGVVVAVGDAVRGIEVGDHVVLSFDACGACANCHEGHPAYCDTFLPRNLSGRRLDGSSPATDAHGEPVGARWFGQSSFATHALASPRNAVVVDRSLPLELLGPLGCGIQGDAVPHTFIPELIDHWQAGNFPFDRLIEKFPLDRIDEAEAASAAGEVVKPVLLP